MSSAEFLQRAARVMKVTQESWATALPLLMASRSRSAILIDTATTALCSAPRMVSSRIWARMRRDRSEQAQSLLLIR